LCPLAGPGAELGGPNRSVPETAPTTPSKVSVQIVASRPTRPARSSEKPSDPLIPKLKVRVGA